MSAPGLKLFLSTVTAEFRSYRDILRADLKGPLLEVKVQEDFIHLGGDTLSLLDDYIAVCDAVIHLIGDATGAAPAPHSVQLLLKRYPDFAARVPTIADLLPAAEFSYTQWEAYLALYHGKTLFIYQPSPDAPKDAEFTPDAVQKDAQHQHLLRLQAIDRWAGTFLNHERLSTKVYQSIFNQQWGDRRGKDHLPGAQSMAAISSPRLHYEHLKAEKLIGRERELARLDRAWARDGEPSRVSGRVAPSNIAIVRAWGGVGKTALVAAWLSEMAARGWRGAQRVFDWSFYLQGTRPDGEEAKGASADAFFNEALKFFGAAESHPISPYERGSLLARLVAESKSLLILDGLEPLQHAPGSPQAGQLTDPGMSVLLKSLARQNAGLCIVTTREKVADLNSFYGKTVDEWELRHLTDDAGAELLNTLGVVGTAKERRTASREVKGHALTLLLMGRYLALAHEGDVRQRDRFKFTEADNETQGGHAFRVLQAYETWLPRSGESGRRQLAILHVLGLFDRPADPGCLAALRQSPVIAGLTDDIVGISDAQWNIAVKRLEEIGLVTCVAYRLLVVKGYTKNEAEKSWEKQRRGLQWYLPEPKEFRSPSAIRPLSSFSLDAHPLLREHFATQLRQTANATWRDAQRRLFEHLQASVPYWPEGIEGLGPLYQAVAHGCQGALEQTACDEVYTNRILRGTRGFYSTRKLGAIVADLGAVACFFTKRWRTVTPNLAPLSQAWLFNEAAFRLRALGHLNEAVESTSEGLQMHIAMEDWRNAAIAAGTLSELAITVGEMTAALAKGEQSVVFADRSPSVGQRMTKRATYGDALHQAGQRDKSLHFFRRAEDLQPEYQREYPRLYSLQGFRYCDLLLAEAERAAWRVILQHPSDAKRSQGVVNQPASERLAATDQHDFQSKCYEVTQRAKYALDIATQNQWLLAIALDSLTITRAAFYAAQLDPSYFLPPSCEFTVDGLRRAEQLHFVPLGLLTQAWWRYVLGDTEGCRADLDEAWEIAEPGPMRLHMADILLYRARLFRDKGALAEARKLIEQCGYWRRKEELEDAEAALA